MFLVFGYGIAKGQTEADSVYSLLKPIKFYNLTSSFDTISGELNYELYDIKRRGFSAWKYGRASKKLNNCCPCLIQYYDQKKKLILEDVICGECNVGISKTYYPNGKLKESGQYKTSQSVTFTEIFEEGNCSVKEGNWLYFNPQGELLYTELWKDGEFVKQSPEQAKREIWKVDLLLNNENATVKQLLKSDFNNLKVVPRFKNSNSKTDDLSLVLKAQTTREKFKRYSDTIAFQSFETFSLDTFLSKYDIGFQHKPKFYLSLLSPEERIIYFELDIQQNSLFGIEELVDSVNSENNVSELQYLRMDRFNFYLVNSLDPLKKVKLSNRESYGIKYESFDLENGIYSKVVDLSGRIDSLNDSSLVFEFESESTFIEYKNGMVSNIQNNWNCFECREYSTSQGYGVATVDLKLLTKLDYSTRARSNLNSFGTVISTFSMITTLVVAPLVSINYRQGGFNSQRYFTIAGAGLAGLSVGIPLIFLSQNLQTCKLAPKGIRQSHDYWYLEAERN